MMMKKISAFVLATLMLLTLAFGAFAENPIDGGWSESASHTLTPEQKDIATKALADLAGTNYTPVAYIASQVVAGTNYMILCEETTATEKPETSYKMVVVYADLEGNAEFASINDFEYVAYTVGDSEEISAENLAGGWSVPDDAAGSAVPDDAKEAFDKAVGAFTGAEIVPLALLGNQIVAGTNYAFICKSTLTTEEPVTGIQIVTVYADLEDNAEIIGISTVDPADFNK